MQREIVARTDLVDLRSHAKSWELLRHTRMPAVRIDVGYLTNPGDAARLADPAFRDVVAEAVVVAVQRMYLNPETDTRTGLLRLDEAARRPPVAAREHRRGGGIEKFTSLWFASHRRGHRPPVDGGGRAGRHRQDRARQRVRQGQVHIEGTFGKKGTVRGTFTPRRFKVTDAGVLKAVGRLKATLVRGNGDVVGTTTERVKRPVLVPDGSTAGTAAAQAGACDILHLALAPLDLDLLGLQVHRDKVVLNIVAQSGAGNLLGNLLCAVAGLLDQSGALSGLLAQVSQILNSILAILKAVTA